MMILDLTAKLVAQHIWMNRYYLSCKKSTSDPGTMYLNEALEDHDPPEFKKAVLNEVEQKIKRNNWKLVLKSN
jgi:hypothetical protein